MKKNNYTPQLPEKKINQIVQELANPKLTSISQPTEEDLLLQILESKLKKGLIKVELKQGKFSLHAQNGKQGINTIIKIYDKEIKS